MKGDLIKRTSIIVVASIFLSLCFTPIASSIPATTGTLTPSRAELIWAYSRAVVYWRIRSPPCGNPAISVGAIPPNSAGYAVWSACSITFSDTDDWHDFWQATCVVYVHEFGHLVLGPTYFASTNPSDPSHSANPNNIMYGGRTTWREEARMAKSTGCTHR